MSNPQKAKGKRVESQVCKILEDTLGGSFQSVPNSGAFLGGQNAYRMAKLSESQVLLHRGDIIPDDSVPNLIVECKGRLKFPFHQLIQDNGCKELNGWIEQVEVDWNAGDKRGFYCVVFKPNTLGFYICYPMGYHMRMGCAPVLSPECDKALLKDLTLPVNQALYKYNGGIYVVSELSRDWLVANREWFQKQCSR